MEERKMRPRPRRSRRKVCKFCVEKATGIDYKDIKKLTGFISETGKIMPRRMSGVCAEHQRDLAVAIKQARSKSLFIAQMMGVSWGALAGAFLAPFLYGLYSKRATKLSAAVCFAWGVGLETIQLLVSLGLLDVSCCALLAFVFKNSIYSGVIARVGGLILVPLCDLCSGKLRPVHVEEMFSAYDERRTVDITDNLVK